MSTIDKIVLDGQQVDAVYLDGVKIWEVEPAGPDVPKAIVTTQGSLIMTYDNKSYSVGQTIDIDDKIISETIEKVYEIPSDNTDDHVEWFGRYIIKVLILPNFYSFTPTSVKSWFRGITQTPDWDGLEYINTSMVTDFSYCFADIENSFTDIDLSSWLFTEATDLSYMFAESRNIKTINLGDKWNMPEEMPYLSSTSHMFSDNRELEHIYCELDFREFSSLGESNYMFASCYNLPNFEASATNRSRAYVGTNGYFEEAPKHMKALYDGATEEVLLVYDNVEYEVGEQYEIDDYGTITISECERIPRNSEWSGELPWYNWWFTAIIVHSTMQQSNAINTQGWFGNWGTTFDFWISDIGNLNFKYIYLANDMFANDKFSFGDNTTFMDNKRLVSASGMFSSSALEEINLSNWTNDNLKDTSNMFWGCRMVENIYVDSSKWKTKRVEDSGNMFAESSHLPNYDRNHVDISKAYVGDGGYLTEW